MMDAMPKTKKAVSKKRAKPASARLPEKAGAKKVSGTVLKIVNGKPTDEKLSAERAFSDLEQARAQVLYVEKNGSREEKRLVRLAFRQYQGMRFRGK
jgi:hypothetical protein